MDEDFEIDDELDLLDSDNNSPVHAPSKPPAAAAATASSSSFSSSAAAHAPSTIAPPATVKPPTSGLAPLAPLKPLGGSSHAPLAPLKPMLPSTAPKPPAAAVATVEVESGSDRSDEEEETKNEEQPKPVKTSTPPLPAPAKHSEPHPEPATATSSSSFPPAASSKTPLSPLAPLKPASGSGLTPLAPLKPLASSSSVHPPSSMSSAPLVAKAPHAHTATPAAASSSSSSSKQASLCENCLSSIATVHCNDCKLNLCQMDCDKELHILVSKSKHVRVPIDGNAPSSKPTAVSTYKSLDDKQVAPKFSAPPKASALVTSSAATSIVASQNMCDVCASAVSTIYCKDCDLYLCQMDCDKEQHILVSKSKHVRVPYPASTQAPVAVKPTQATSSSSSSAPSFQKTSSLPTAADAKKLCSNCFSSIATIYCKECDLYLCQMDCDKEMHILVSKSKHHRVPFPFTNASADVKPSTVSPPAPAKTLPKLSSSSSSASIAASSSSSSSSKIVLCDNCQSSTATLHCNDCNKNLCESDCDKEVHILVSKSKHLRTRIGVSASSHAVEKSSAPQNNKRSSKRSSFTFGSSVTETASIPSSSSATKPVSSFTPMNTNLSSPSPSPSPAPPSLSSTMSTTMSTSMFSPTSQILCDHCCSTVATVFCAECDLRLCQSNCDHELHILVRTARHKRVPWPLSPNGQFPLTSPVDERGIRRASAGLEFAKQRNRSRSRSRSRSPPPRTQTEQHHHETQHSGRKALSSARRASTNKNLPPLEVGGGSGNNEHDREREKDRARERARRAEAERTAASMSAMRQTSHQYNSNTFSPPPPLNVSTPSHNNAHSPSQPTSAKPVEVSVRHKKHAQMMPPAVSPHHASWEDELHHELRDDQHPLQGVRHEFKEAEVYQEFRRTNSSLQKQEEQQLAEERMSGGGTRFPSILRPGVPHGPIDPAAAGSQNRPASAQRASLLQSQKKRAEQSLAPQSGSGSPAIGAVGSRGGSIIQGSPSKPPRKLNFSPAFVDPQPGESVLSVFTGTWNLHAKPFPDNLSEFIPRDSYDLYVIGTEECENSIEVSMIFTSKEKWTKCLGELLGDGYEEIAQQTLQAIHVIAFIRKSLVPYVHHIEAASVATGIGDVLGNKGGVGLGFDISNTSFLFINSHFAAHQYKVQQRNDDFHKINARMPLKQKLLTQERYAHLTNVCDRFDRVFWLGDLNYRVGGNRAMVDSLISQRMIEVMLHNDQLNQERIHGRVFKGFVEGEITFMPTYKFDNKTDRYDTSKKARIPSYTDRILWRPSTSIELLEYNSVPTVRSSDHRPVFATFKVKVKQHAENEERKRKKYVNGEQPGSRACVIQ